MATYDDVVLCGASAYSRLFYMNETFDNLPQAIKDELKIACVVFTEDVGGTIQMKYTKKGKLYLETSCNEGDLLYDEIGSALKIRQLQREKEELFKSLEMYYCAFTGIAFEESEDDED